MDAVDNSGGVNLSDYEVNLKTFLSEPIRQGELSLDERNELLDAHAEFGCEHVLARSRSQNQLLSLAIKRSKKNLDYYWALIDLLELQGILDRKLHNLPSEEARLKHTEPELGLTRPELAKLIGFTKMSLASSIVQSKLPNVKYLERYITRYFPEAIVAKYEKYISAHPLQTEIIATELSNELVDNVGANFVFRVALETGAVEEDVILAYVAAHEILDVNHCRELLSSAVGLSGARAQLNAVLQMAAVTDGITRWILRGPHRSQTPDAIITRYHVRLRVLFEHTESLLSDADLTKYREDYKKLLVSGMPEELARRIVALPFATSYLDIVEVADKTNTEILNAAKLHSNLSLVLEIRQLLERSNEIESNNRWEALSIRALNVELNDSLAQLATSIIMEMGDASEDSMSAYLAKRKEILRRYQQSLDEFRTRQMGIPALVVISKQLQALARPDLLDASL